MDKFLAHSDELALRINRCARELYERLSNVDPYSLGMPQHCLYYYKTSHSKRLFFSIETSAHLLYRAIRISGKKVEDVILMDYGAGVGTLFLLAKFIGCRKVVYNDHLEEWRQSAELIARATNIEIDQYVVGDIEQCLDELDDAGVTCDIITSRNVIEHIYRLDLFFSALHTRQPRTVIFSSTTANNSNPASLLKHMMWHRKWESVYFAKRQTMISRSGAGLDRTQIRELAKASRGLAMSDLADAVTRYAKTRYLPDASIHRTNTCDPETGVWAEHLLSAEEYRKLINEQLFEVQLHPGFWDTHYTAPYKNMLGRLLNSLIRAGIFGMQLAPFIYVVAIPKKLEK